MTTQINHTDYMKKVRTMSDYALYYTIKDCKETLALNPEGEKAGYYQDEINYCAMEISRRKGYNIDVKSIM
jgi:hypothetical protein